MSGVEIWKQRMEERRARFKTAALVALAVLLGVGALYGLLKPVPGGCIMTYMYPTYVPISTPANLSSDKYGLYLYHEGWKPIDFAEHLRKLDGVPVLFIPGNGGSYKQVRSLAAESSRAYEAGPLEPSYYQEDLIEDVHDVVFPRQYKHKLNWFAVDLEGEHSAMDGRILKEHTEYVVYAIHRILDQYQESREAQSRDSAEVSGNLPTTVILVGHSMGGFVARAALVHPHLRKSSVETILTLSTPHQAPPIALQPSLGLYYAEVNEKWKEGYVPKINHARRLVSSPALSHVIIVSVSGGVHDYQVRSKLASLDGIVPSTHGFAIGSTSMKNVWLSMDHQSILWCNQLVVQISHTLLSTVNLEGKPIESAHKRLVVFAKMLQSGLPESFNFIKHPSSEATEVVHAKISGAIKVSETQGILSCPPSIYWEDVGLEKDLYIRSTSVTILAMDGRRRWLDIDKLGDHGKRDFMLVTNLAPCYGIRLHLWPKKHSSGNNMSTNNKILEVTSKMVRVPSGPAPRQIEPGSQTEQAPPSAVLRLTPDDMRGYRFLTISVAPRLSVSGRPPPAASMAVGQFYNPQKGQRQFSSIALLKSSYVQEDLFIEEDHPLALDISFPVSLGILPVNLSMRTTGCGIKNSEQTQNVDMSGLCKLRCFPPLALAWDSMSGMYITPNLQSETIFVDSAPASWDAKPGSDETTMLLLVDPHCSYRISFAVSLTASASRFCLLYSPQIVGLMVALCFFGLMRQERAWELDLSIPSILTVVEFNMRMPLPFLLLVILPTVFTLLLSGFARGQFPPAASFIAVTLACYLIANGVLIILILSTRLVLFVAAISHVFIKRRWQLWQETPRINFLRQILDLSSIFYSFKVVRILRANPNLVVVSVTIPLIIFVHPSLGLIVLLLYHTLNCHLALSSFLGASFHGHAQQEFCMSNTKVDPSMLSTATATREFDSLLPMDGSGSGSPKSSFPDSQLEIFNYQHGMMMLHLLASLMFVPSLVAWMQRIGMGQSFPSVIDSSICAGVILHGLYGSKLDIICSSFPLLGHPGREFGLSIMYLISGYYSFLVALALAPYKTFYAMGACGAICLLYRIIGRRQRQKGDGYFKRRRHSHNH